MLYSKIKNHFKKLHNYKVYFYTPDVVEHNRIEMETSMSIKETDLYSKIENTGPFANKPFHYEVRIGDWTTSRKKIDMVTLKNRRLISIEVKISNWKKALQQAYSNMYVFDYSYVALWHKTVPNVDLEIFKDLGIGILEVNESCNEVIKAKRSKLVIASSKSYAKNYINQKSEIMHD